MPGRHSPAAVVLVAASLSLATARVHAQPSGAGVAPLLTPASVALLAGRTDAESAAKLRTALAHENPTVRAIATRIAGVQKMPAMAPEIARVFEGEPDDRAAAEQVRALLLIDNASWRDTIERRLSVTQPLAIRAYVEWMVRNRPEMLADQMADVFRPVPATELDRFSVLVSAAIRHHPAIAERFLRGWMRIASGQAWRSVVTATSGAAGEPEAAILREALEAQNAEVRQETVWAIILRITYGQAVAPAVLEAALPRPTAADAPVTWEMVGRELVARIHRGVSTPDRAGIYKAEAARRREDIVAASHLPQLTVQERETLREVLKDKMPQPHKPTRPKPPQQEDKKPDSPRSMPMRTVPTPWPGLVADLLHASGCQVTDTSRVGGFGLAFRADGRPERADLARHELPPECDQVLAALARLTLADVSDPIVPGAMQMFVLPLNRDYVACVSELKPVSRVHAIRAGTIEQPRKIRHVNPRYPAVAQQNRVQGLVIVEGTMSGSGCVLSLAVLRSVHPLLDMAAIQAVSGWRFTPTLVDGEPVPVIMTVTVNFVLE